MSVAHIHGHETHFPFPFGYSTSFIMIKCESMWDQEKGFTNS